MFLILIVVLVVGYLYYQSSFTYFSRRGIPGPVPLPFFGNLVKMYFRSIPQLELENRSRFGNIYGHYEGLTPVLNVADPVLIKDIAVKDFDHFVDRRDVSSKHRIFRHVLPTLKGDKWRRMRKTMTPSFTSGKMKAMMTILNDCVDDLVESLDEKASNQQDLNSIDTFGFYTMDVVARCVFAAITNVQKLGYDSEFMQKAARFLSRTFLMEKSMMVLSLLLPKSIFDVLMTLSQKADDVGYLEKIVLHIASQRTQEVRERSYKDLLQLLLDVNQNEMPRTKTTGNLMSNDELVANSLIVLGAGQETPAALLTYMSLILAKHQDIQNRLRKEIRKWYENAGNKFKYEDLTILPYLDAVVSETLRMYPPAVRFERTCTKDYSTEAMIGGRRVRLDIKKGDHIRIPIYAIHHDPVNHNDPEQYKPERFLLQNRDNLIPYTYLPFGTGPRACIGMRFALIEVKLALAKLILKFKFTLSRRTPKALDFSNVFALLSPKNVIVGIEKVSIEDEGHTTNDD